MITLHDAEPQGAEKNNLASVNAVNGDILVSKCIPTYFNVDC